MKNAMLQPSLLQIACLSLFTLVLSAPAVAQTQPTGSSKVLNELLLMETIELEPKEEKTVQLRGRIDRISIADDKVADVIPTRGRNNDVDGLMFRGLTLGQTYVNVWWKGQDMPTRYEVYVDRKFQSSLRLNAPKGVPTLTGTAKSLKDLQTAQETAKLIAGGPVVDRTQLDVPRSVQIQVKVVEFNRKLLKEAGISFSRQGGSSGFTFNSGTFNLSKAPNFTSTAVNMKLLETNGLTKTLAEPNLVALSGEKASFLAGGEIPIPVPGANGAIGIEYRKFGVSLDVQPTVLDKDRVLLKVAPEASDLDFSNGITIQGTVVPAISKRRADTTLELKHGESFVIGGLVSRSTASNVDKVPLLGDLPVLGAFFRQMRFSDKETELVMVVTPYLIDPKTGAPKAELANENLQTDATKVWSEYWLGAPQNEWGLPGFSR